MITLVTHRISLVFSLLGHSFICHDDHDDNDKMMNNDDK